MAIPPVHSGDRRASLRSARDDTGKNHTPTMIAKENSNPLLSARTALLFFATVVLAYLLAGLVLQTTLGLWGIFLNQVLFLFLPTLLLCSVRGVPLFEWPSWRRPALSDLLLTTMGMLFLCLAIDPLVALQDRYFPPPEKVREFYERLIAIHSFKEGTAKLLILALTPAFVEEIFFRGLLQESWVGRFGKKWGILLSSLAFALAHGNFWHFHFYFVLGIFLGSVYEWRRCLWLPIAAHFVNNVWTLLMH